MGTVTNLQVASFTWGLLGIASSFLVLMGPRPQVLDIYSNKTCLQRLLSLDGGFSETVDEAFGFPGTVLFTSIVHILAHASLLYGAIQPINGIMMYRYAIYQFITLLLCSMLSQIIITSSSSLFGLSPPYEYLLLVMCLWPMESVPILYAQSATLAVCVFFTRFFLVDYIFNEGTKPAPQNKIDDDQVSVISV